MSGERPSPARGEELHELFRQVFILREELYKVMDETHERAGLSTPKIRIMRLLRLAGPATVPDLAAGLGVSRQFVQKTCNELSGSGHVEYFANPRHKKSRLVRLRALGEKAFDAARKNEERIIETALPGIESGGVAQAVALLKRIRESLSAFL